MNIDSWPLPLQSLVVLTAQFLLYAALPLWAMRLPARRPASWIQSLVLALAAQSAIGLVASWVIPQAQHWVPWFYGLAWLAVRLVRPRPADPSNANERFDPFLVFLLVLSIVIRWIHPWQTWALGQSDAYAHLMFINDVVHGGRLSNPIYPPGFAWIMALPAVVVGLDPYVLARFGGAFHGAALVLALYVLVNEWAGRNGARVAAAVATGFPLAWVLTKTGVGVFANQVGLLALPVAWWSVWQCWTNEPSRLFALTLAAVFLLLGIATPMILIQLCLLLGFAAIAMFVRDSGSWSRSLRIAMLAIPGALLFLAHLLHAGGVARGQTSAYLVGEEVSGPINQEDADPSMDIESNHVTGMVEDFFKIKRFGFGSWVLNAPVILAFAAFVCSGVIGFRLRRVSLILLGVWGAVTTLQTATGVWQLSFYQREGWSWMIASIVLGGVLTEEALRTRQLRSLRAPVLVVSMIAALAGVIWPPAHRVFASPAENELIAFIRAANGDRAARRLWPELVEEWSVLDGASRIHMVVRPISGFSNRIGDPVHALATGRLRARDRAVAPEAGELTVGLLDAADEVPARAGLVMGLLQPGLTDEFMKRRHNAAIESAALERELRSLGLPERIWMLSPRLRALLLFPAESGVHHE